MERKIFNERNAPGYFDDISTFDVLANKVNDIFGFPSDNKTLFERYRDNPGLSTILGSNSSNVPSNTQNLWWATTGADKSEYKNLFNASSPFPKNAGVFDPSTSTYMQAGSPYLA